MRSLLGSNLGCRFFLFITLNRSCHSLQACRVFAEKSAVNLMGVPLYVICLFSLAAFNNFSLPLIFANLMTICLIVFLLGFILYGTLCASWTWVAISFPMLGKFLTIICSNIFSHPFSLSSLSGTPIMPMLLKLILSQRSLRLSSFLFILFSLFCFAAVNSTILSSRSLICSSVSVILLLIPSSVFFILVIVLFILVCLFFNSSRSWLNISCIFSIFASILFQRSWIIFTIIILNSFSGRLPISASFSCFSGVLSCSFIWCIALCL
uniref:Uncharacterized protein n=1 Tax=Monodon monoceros TaxID=40151 RepID=A0A8C6CBZ5_MONMO